MSDRDGGPAFPMAAGITELPEGMAFTLQRDGMSLRDYFAGQALAGALANERFHLFGSDGDTLESKIAAENAYAFANAMLAERAKP
jgi:hypothetical protein